jgi:hypothetical protein
MQVATMKTPQAPAAPDPVATAKAQTENNKATAITNYGLNATNQVTPYGNLTYNQVGTWADGTPRYEATTSLTPQAQDTLDKTMGVQNKYATVAGNQFDKVSDALSNPWKTPDGLTSPETFSFDQYKSVLDSLGKSPLPTDFSADRQRIETSLYDRMSPLLQQGRDALETKLVNQGFSRGTDAFKTAMDEASRRENDARLAVVGQGGTEQSNLFNMALAGRNQGLTEAYTPYNMARQDFGNQMALRQQQLQEALQERTQPLNELSALMSGSQVQNPNFVNTPNVNMANTDVAGITQNAYENQMKQYQTQMAQNNAMMGGLFGLGGTLGGAMLGGPAGGIGTALGGWLTRKLA